MLLTGDPGVGKSLALRRFTDSLNENLFQAFYTPLSTLTRIDMLRHLNRLLGLPLRNSKSASHTQIQTYLVESREQRGGKPSSLPSTRHNCSRPAPWRNCA